MVLYTCTALVVVCSKQIVGHGQVNGTTGQRMAVDYVVVEDRQPRRQIPDRSLLQESIVAIVDY